MVLRTSLSELNKRQNVIITLVTPLLQLQTPTSKFLTHRSDETRKLHFLQCQKKEPERKTKNTWYLPHKWLPPSGLYWSCLLWVWIQKEVGEKWWQWREGKLIPGHLVCVPLQTSERDHSTAGSGFGTGHHDSTDQDTGQQTCFNETNPIHGFPPPYSSC